MLTNKIFNASALADIESVAAAAIIILFIEFL